MIAAALLFTLGFVKAETPQVVMRKEMPYIAVHTRETMGSLGSVMPRFVPQLYKWCGERGIPSTGPIFIRYVFIDMARGIDLEIGLPVPLLVKGDAKIMTGVIPAGKYISLVHHGDYSGLVASNAALQEWAKEKGFQIKMRKGTRGLEFVSRLESYRTDPEKVRDPNKWETELLYMVK